MRQLKQQLSAVCTADTVCTGHPLSHLGTTQPPELGTPSSAGAGRWAQWQSWPEHTAHVGWTIISSAAGPRTMPFDCCALCCAAEHRPGPLKHWPEFSCIADCWPSMAMGAEHPIRQDASLPLTRRSNQQLCPTTGLLLSLMAHRTSEKPAACWRASRLQPQVGC
jgi:hypothetical protein